MSEATEKVPKKRSGAEEMQRLKRKIRKLEEKDNESALHQSGEYSDQEPGLLESSDSDELVQSDTSLTNVRYPKLRISLGATALHREAEMSIAPTLNNNSKTANIPSTGRFQVKGVLPASSLRENAERSLPNIDISRAYRMKENPDRPSASTDTRVSLEEDESDNNKSIQHRNVALLNALGDDVSSSGENIHNNLAQKWIPILQKGLDRTARDQIIRQYAAPDNCRLLKAPILNKEVAAVVEFDSRSRDSSKEHDQNQLGLGITAISRGITELIELRASSDVNAMKHLYHGCRMLLDLHHKKTNARRYLFNKDLNRIKVFKRLRFQEHVRDETLFGSKFGKWIKQQAVPKGSAPAAPFSSTHRNGREEGLRFRQNGDVAGRSQI